MFVPIHEGGLDLKWISSKVRSVSFVIEVGANSGTDTQKMLEVFPDADVWCFEPDPRAIRLWHANVASPRAELFEIAVSDESGKRTFFQSGGIPPGFTEQDFPEGWHLSGSVVKPKNHALVHEWSEFSKSIEVTSRTLDEITRNRREATADSLPIDLIWADVQGAEEALIRGGFETLKKTKFFYTEFSNDELYLGQPNLRKLLQLLPNFKVRKLWKHDILFQNKAFTSR